MVKKVVLFIVQGVNICCEQWGELVCWARLNTDSNSFGVFTVPLTQPLASPRSDGSI